MHRCTKFSSHRDMLRRRKPSRESKGAPERGGRESERSNRFQTVTDDLAFIMYTSGTTGVPKVRRGACPYLVTLDSSRLS